MEIELRSRGKQRLARLCLEAKLFKKDWALEGCLIDVSSETNTNKTRFRKAIVIVAFHDGVPIGVLHSWYLTMIFIKPSYRDKGIGTSLIIKLDEILVARNIKRPIRMAKGVGNTPRFLDSIKSKVNRKTFYLG